jgi:hypothetical protein
MNGYSVGFPLSQIEDLLALLIAASVSIFYVSKNSFATDNETVKKISLWVAFTPVLVPFCLIGALLIFSLFAGGFTIISGHIVSTFISPLYLVELILYRVATTIIIFFFMRYYLRQGSS